MNILVAGGSGFIGQALCAYLKRQGHRISILTRRPQQISHLDFDIISWTGQYCPSTEAFDVIINLSGENIGAKRWTVARKAALVDSRINSTRAWFHYFKQYDAVSDDNCKKPLFLNASAVGIYANSDAIQDEQVDISTQDLCFTQRLVLDWENEALAIRKLGVSVSCLRFGVVLGRQGGMLAKLLPSFRLGLGAIIGQGNEYLSWIHIDDLCRAVAHIIAQKERQTVYNLTSDMACTQRQFADSLAHACHRPRFLKLSPWWVKTLFGEMGQSLMLANHNIRPTHLQQSGFEFQYPDIGPALKHLVRGGS